MSVMRKINWLANQPTDVPVAKHVEMDDNMGKPININRGVCKIEITNENGQVTSYDAIITDESFRISSGATAHVFNRNASVLEYLEAHKKEVTIKFIEVSHIKKVKQKDSIIKLPKTIEEEEML